MTMSILKDRAFALYFGKSAKGKTVQPISLFFWLIRDVLTMAGAFVIPSRLALLLQRRMGLSEEIAQNTSQFFCPVFFQFALTPIHLIGYDYYNYPDKKIPQRVSYLAKMYPQSVGIRMIRMGGAYGIGGVNNRNFRDYLISKFEGNGWDESY